MHQLIRQHTQNNHLHRTSFFGKDTVYPKADNVVRESSSRDQLIQRACGSDAIGPTPADCILVSKPPTGNRFLFKVNCDEFETGEEVRLRTFAASVPTGSQVEVLGMASSDGDHDFNVSLSCHRATAAANVLGSAGVANLSIEATGPVPSSAGIPFLRAADIRVNTPEPEQICGPDATDWFVDQVAAAKRDPIVLAIKQRLAGAERVARRFGFSAQRIAEGAVAKKVVAEHRRQGSPTLTPEARSQLAASVPGQREFGRAMLAATVPLAGAPEAMVLAAIRGAALTWKGLVGTGRKYDFKNRAETLQNPTTPNCPVNCASTITLCPSLANNCFIKDVPGNLFYAYVGRFVGWTELTLQLGSQFAQLESSARWDPPEDTRMINFGFGLPDPLSQTALCGAINSNLGIFDMRTCENCSDTVNADIV